MWRMRLRQPRRARGRSSESDVPARGGSASSRPRNRRRIVSPSRSRQPSNSVRRDRSRSTRDRSPSRRRLVSRRRSFSPRSRPQQNPEAHCRVLLWSQISGSGLPLGAKFYLELTKKTPFLRCFDLKTLQIRGVTFEIPEAHEYA